MNYRLAILANVFLISSSLYSSPLEDGAEVMEHCLVDASQEVEICWKQILFEDGSYEVLATSEVDEFFWIRPQLAEELQWQIESKDYIDSLPIHYRTVTPFDYNTLVQMYYLGDEEAISFRSVDEAPAKMESNKEDDCILENKGQCASGIIGGAIGGGIAGAYTGGKTGGLFGPKGAAAGIVIGGTAGAIGGAATGHAQTSACGCKSSGGGSGSPQKHIK